MQIVRAKPQDAAALTEIAIRAKGHWGYPESWMADWREILTVRPESIMDYEVYCAIAGGPIVGFYTLAAEGGKLCLEDLWVLPEAMGRGVGRELFEHALKRAKGLGYMFFEIESDPNAEGFYLRMGAYRVQSRVREVATQARKLPLLVCRTDRVI